MKRIIQIIALLVFASITMLAQDKVDQKTVVEKYEEVSRLETLEECREFLGKQTEEMKIALWHENLNRKTSRIELSAEQREILNTIRNKFMTVEYAKSVRGKSEAEAGHEFKEIMARATQLLGKENL